MIALKSTATGGTVFCTCCGKGFTAGDTIRGITIPVGKVQVRAELCAHCHRKAESSQRALKAIGKRVIDRHASEFTALLLPLHLLSPKAGRAQR